MSQTLKSLLAAANAVVERVDVARAQQLLRERGAVLLDVREPPEVAATGLARGARAIPRGLLEFRADPAEPGHDAELRPDRPIVVYCAAGGRAALAGKLLRDMGYHEVYSLGGFKDWIEGGGEVEERAEA